MKYLRVRICRGGAAALALASWLVVGVGVFGCAVTDPGWGAPTGDVAGTPTTAPAGGTPEAFVTPRPDLSIAPSSVVSRTASTIAGLFPGKLRESFDSALGSILATFVVVLFVGLMVALCVGICRRMSRPPVQVRLQAFSLKQGEPVVHGGLASSVQLAFQRLREDVALVEGRIAFYDEWLRRFGFCELMPAAVAETGGVDISVSLGPVAISAPRGWSDRIVGRRTFLMSVFSDPSSSRGDTWDLLFTLSASGGVSYACWKRVVDEDVEEAILDIARVTAWVISGHGEREVRLLGLETPPEVHILRGIHLLSDYMRTLQNTRPLEKALEHFDAAGRAGGEQWEFQAGLLRAIIMQLTQESPPETVRRMEDLLVKFGDDTARRQVLTYNLAQAQFYTYGREAYEQALDGFREIGRPCPLMWKVSRRLWGRAVSMRKFTRYQYGLYCLAQCNIAIVLAHKMGHRLTADENEALRARTSEIVEQVRKELRSTRGLLAPFLGEIEWRAYNAEAVTALNLRDNVEAGIRAAERALERAPYALDAKANLGSLNLLVARMRAAAGDDARGTPEFKLAAEIFEGLLGIGWDPGFVQYRLGEIRRVQGKLEDARQLLDSALEPEIRDVCPQHIKRELGRVESGDIALYLE